jgi:hypothetical protein
MDSSDKKWVLVSVGLVVLVVALPLVLLGPLHLAGDNAGKLAAVLAFAGVLVTAAVSVIGFTVTRQSERRLSREGEDESRRLRLDAAMRAGASFSSPTSEPVDPASIASSLLALTELDNADLAVALLVEFWSRRTEKVSTETAILIIDAALRSKQPNAQLIAAELLCKNAQNLGSCESLHWPSVIDGCWVQEFGPKTKLLLVEALIIMTLARPVNENSLRSVAVRLYGIFAGDSDERVKGCVATLIESLIPSLENQGYQDFMQGNQKVMLSDLRSAAGQATENPDGFLDRIVKDRSQKLGDWAAPCTRGKLELGPGALATAIHN